MRISIYDYFLSAAALSSFFPPSRARGTAAGRRCRGVTLVAPGPDGLSGLKFQRSTETEPASIKANQTTSLVTKLLLCNGIVLEAPASRARHRARSRPRKFGSPVLLPPFVPTPPPRPYDSASDLRNEDERTKKTKRAKGRRNESSRIKPNGDGSSKHSFKACYGMRAPDKLVVLAAGGRGLL